MAASQFRTEYYNEYRTYLSRLGGDNSGARNLLKRNLLRAIREELTPRQWQMIRLYYIDELNMAAIAEMLGVNISTVSRTIARGKRKLQRCLRYGAKELLRSLDEPEELSFSGRPQS